MEGNNAQSFINFKTYNFFKKTKQQKAFSRGEPYVQIF